MAVRRLTRAPMLLLTALLLVLSLIGCSDGGGDAAPLRIDTTSGQLRGHVSDGVRRFDGVRYANAPTGDRRWTLPEPVDAPDDEVDATKPGPACPQDTSQPMAIDAGTSEDCLFLNVTTPSRTSDHPWPVMVWWHGGGFTSGAGSQYDAQRLADRGDVAVVTLNYRLGMLGYLGLPGLEGGGNFGLADQIAGLRWAKDNAAAFGGDADDITVFGESAGGTSTCAALTSPQARDLIDRAIFSSGSCRLQWPKGTLFPGLPAARSLISRDVSESIGLGVAKELKCGGGDPVACLRRQPVDALVKQGPAFGNPLAYDTELLPKDPAVAIEQGDVADVPVIAGGNRDEHRAFVGGLLLTDPSAITQQNYASLVRTSFGDGADAVLRHYPVGGDAPAAWSTLVTDVAWSCTTTRVARDLAAAGADVHAYEFAQRDAPDVNGVGKSGLHQGAAHATDLPYLFDLAGHDLLRTRAQRDLSDTMIDLWTSFARDGSPQAAGVEWPATTPQEAPVLGLDSPVRTVDFAQEHQCAFWSSIGY